MSHTFGDLATELARERPVIGPSHLDDLRRQQAKLDELINHTESGESDDGAVRVSMDSRLQISRVWVSPMIIEQFSAARLLAAVREAVNSANTKLAATLQQRGRTELGINTPAVRDWPAQVRRSEEALRTMIITMRRLAPTLAAQIEDALTAVTEFRHATFSAASAGDEITATVDARGDIVDLVVDEVQRRMVDNLTFSGWLESALSAALVQRAARQHQVSQFSMPST
ncbi:YbaB/EbfC family nucleoid-associated protein [Propionibacteriaceae bacterium Y1685]